ncbi:hypothetical protein A1O7_03587 [Cladophialophora yegresii CBS 114405]|uniref:Uncharacterized protein n=1 Tax=Cladophialophora yegresii CBS 114405 TaxID=1182544 RepID=W9W4Z4_9EURO|nr:uncharacterized protein A1O7_03587 [Cladophialophora yegresii CBS 114405]EXJ63142.1 hypothetical protein A1O7_03587 [Cladophialophora yegresii CBS 114405]
MAPSPLRDPIDYSPTTSSFLSSTSNAITSGSVRRNLFSTHLSRRPASGAPPPQLDGQNETPASPSQTQAQHQQQQQQQYASHLPRLRTHQRSASTPSLSPSPPRSSPFHNALDGGSAAFIPPPIPQLSPPTRAAVADGYDPTVSPNRPLSPHSSAALFPNQSIIALNPVTGRPVLPKLPVLPSRLRLTDSDDETGEDQEPQGERGAGEDNEDVQVHHHHHHHHSHAAAEEGFSGDEFHHSTVEASTRRAGHRVGRQHQHLYGHDNDHDHDHDHDQPPPSSSIPRGRTAHAHTYDHTHTHTHNDAQAAAMAAARAQAEAVALDELDSERRDRERIERLLREMMARQRARAKGGKSAASSTVAGAEDEDEDEEAQEEKEELMGLIMGSLRREVGRAEDEAWMFGGSLGMGAMVGRDEVGVYD